jgi:hypothetical protein
LFSSLSSSDNALLSFDKGPRIHAVIFLIVATLDRFVYVTSIFNNEGFLKKTLNRI